MSKYAPLWDYVIAQGKSHLVLSFAEIQTVLGFPIDHSFLNKKKELEAAGYVVEKISLTDHWVRFVKK